MDLRQMTVFVTIAEEMSFTRAAHRLHVAQPSLTMQIKRLEQEIGFYLFERTSRSIKLTPSGTMFLDTARQLLTVAQQGRNRAQRAAIGEAGRLVRIPTMPPTYSDLIAPTIPS